MDCGVREREAGGAAGYTNAAANERASEEGPKSGNAERAHRRETNSRQWGSSELQFAFGTDSIYAGKHGPTPTRPCMNE